MRNQYWFWQDGIPHDQCDEIVRRCSLLKSVKGSTFNGADVEENPHRNSTVRWVQDVSGIKELIWPFIWEANRQAFNVDVSGIFEVQFTEYDASEKQYYKWHHDIDWAADTGFDRKLSAVIQLTDSYLYEGGDFEFKTLNSPDGLRNKGAVIVFPSYLEHQVTPVIKGRRHSLVTWVEGPRWK